MVSSERIIRLITALVPTGYRSSTPGFWFWGSRWVNKATSFSSLANADSSAATDVGLTHYESLVVKTWSHNMPSWYSTEIRAPSSGTGNSIERSKVA